MTSSSDEECHSNFQTKFNAKKPCINKSNILKQDLSVEESTIDDKNLIGSIQFQLNDSIETKDNPEEDIIRKSQKKKRRKQSKRNSNLPIEIGNDKSLMKYWLKRYRLFSKFDDGIKLDRGKFKSFLNTIHFVHVN